MSKKAPSYKGRYPSSSQATKAARGASRKADTSCELKLRKALWHSGFRYRKNVAELPGKPDIVFYGARLAVFCDGDFWHGRNWPERKRKLSRGSNSEYWVKKIERNIERDAMNTEALEQSGWQVMRFWESDIHQDVDSVVEQIRSVLQEQARSSNR